MMTLFNSLTWALICLALPFAEAANICPTASTAFPTKRLARDMRDKNISDVLLLYTPDALFVDPDGSRYKGLAELRGLYVRIFATFDSDITFHAGSVSAVTDDGACLESGKYSENLSVRSTGKTNHYTGGYRFEYKLQPNGRWLLFRQEWTAN